MAKKMNFKNASKVLGNIDQMIKADKNDGKILIEALNKTLDDLLCQDFFGTEGQLDPRGDQRD